MPLDIVFIGTSVTGLQALASASDFQIREVLCDAARVPESLPTIADSLDVPLSVFRGRDGLSQALRRHAPTVAALIYQLDLRVPGDLTDRYKIFNLHRGNLMTNRGAHPEVWSILNGDDIATIALHRINEEFDSGQLIASFDVPLRTDDDVSSLRNRLEGGLPYLLGLLAEHLNGGKPGIPLSGGIYRPRITEQDFTIDLQRDSLDVIDRKIRSQRTYQGAILDSDGIRYRVAEIASATRHDGVAPPGVRRFINDRLEVLTKDYLVVFRLKPGIAPMPSTSRSR